MASLFRTSHHPARDCTCWFSGSVQGRRGSHFLSADRGRATLLLFDLHRLSTRSAFLATVRRLVSERYCQRPAAIDASRSGPQASTMQTVLPMIRRESIFDPRVYGLPVEPIVEAFLSSKNGLYGGLNVDIFGGGSWQSGLSAADRCFKTQVSVLMHILFSSLALASAPRQSCPYANSAGLPRRPSHRAAAVTFSTTMIFFTRSALANVFLRTIFLRRSTPIDLKRQIQMHCSWRQQLTPMRKALLPMRRPGFYMR